MDASLWKCCQCGKPRKTKFAKSCTKCDHVTCHGCMRQAAPEYTQDEKAKRDLGAREDHGSYRPSYSHDHGLYTLGSVFDDEGGWPSFTTAGQLDFGNINYEEISLEGEPSARAHSASAQAILQPQGIDPDTHQALETRGKIMKDAKQTERQPKTAELQDCIIDEPELSEQKKKNNDESDAETARKIAEAVAKTKAEMAATHEAKDISDRQRGHEAEVADAEKINEATNAKAEAEAKAKVAIAVAKAQAEEAFMKARPIQFTDAIGRRFAFPFDMCQTWEGMHSLIYQLFEDDKVLGPRVKKRNYDLLGAQGELFLPQFWEMVLQPDWAIFMHMWPLPDPSKEKKEKRKQQTRGRDAIFGSSKQKGRQQAAGWGSIFGLARAPKTSVDAVKEEVGQGQPADQSVLQTHGSDEINEGVPTSTDLSSGAKKRRRKVAFSQPTIQEAETPQTSSTPHTYMYADHPGATSEVLGYEVRNFSTDGSEPKASGKAVDGGQQSQHTLPILPPATVARPGSPPAAHSQPAFLSSPPQNQHRKSGTSIQKISHGTNLLNHSSASENDHSKRSSLLVIWIVVACVAIGIISLIVLVIGTTTGLIDEKKSSNQDSSPPSISDTESLITIQACGWQITNLIAGLIPACMHANRYRKWRRMNYAWLPAMICFVMVVASVPVYLKSPAISDGLAGVSNIPMGLFIFFAGYEAFREEKHMKCCHSAGCTSHCSHAESIKGKDNSIELQRIL